MHESRHVLVIGGGGYVGTVLTDELLTHDYRVRILDNFLYDHFIAAQAILGRPGVSLVVGDVRDGNAVDAALDGVTDVVLLASLVGDPISRKYPQLTREVNIDGSEDLFDRLDGRGLQRFVFTSTCSNYGLRETDEPASEDATLNPLSIYAETKVAFERYILGRNPAVDFAPVILRLSTAFGFSPRMRFDLTVNEFACIAGQGEKLVVYDKDTWRPYCHVRDIAAAVIAALEAPEERVAGEVFNVGSDENNYTKEKIVEEILRHIDVDVSFVEGGKDARNYRVSFAKIHDRLGFTAGHSVSAFIPELIDAVRAGFYSHLDRTREYFGNYAVREGISWSLNSTPAMTKPAQTLAARIAVAPASTVASSVASF